MPLGQVYGHNLIQIPSTTREANAWDLMWVGPVSTAPFSQFYEHAGGHFRELGILDKLSKGRRYRIIWACFVLFQCVGYIEKEMLQVR